MNTKRKTSRGQAGTFDTEGTMGTQDPSETPNLTEEQVERVVKDEAHKKVRTTIMLYPDTLAGLDMLKVHARKQGGKATYSDILEEAIRDLMKKKGVTV